MKSEGFAHTEFYFKLSPAEGGALLSLVSAGKGTPDYRRCVGVGRELLRDFLAQYQESQRAEGLDYFGPERDANTLFNPDDRLIEGALAAGLLAGPDGNRCAAAEGLHRLVLVIRDSPPNHLAVSLTLANEEAGPSTGGGGEAEAGAEEAGGEEPPEMVSPRFALRAGKVYAVEHVGRRWAEAKTLAAKVRREDLSAFLSLALSRFQNIEIDYDAWRVKRTRPAQAQAALLFLEIDKYNYLHLRPVSYLRGFPPLFLENEEIVTVAELDSGSRTLGVAEVVFPPPPDEAFRALLMRGRKTTAKNLVHEESGRFIIAPELAASFFADNIMELSRQFVLLEASVLARYKLSFKRPQVRVSLGSGIDWFEGEVSVEVDGQSFTFSDFMRMYKEAGFVTLADGTRNIPDQRMMERLDRLVSRIKGDSNSVTLSYFDLPLLEQDGNVAIEGAAWTNARPFFKDYNSIDARPGVWTLAEGSLRPYQVYGVKWLDYLREHNMGACLADEMGLGKTVQVIALLRALAREAKAAAKREKKQEGGEGEESKRESKLCLIICPKSLVFNWDAELARFAPEIGRTVHYGAGREAEALRDTDTVHVVLSTYATLRRDIEEFRKHEFFYAILDESQNVKNIATQTALAVMSIKAAHRLALSGTPVENNLGELYSLFHFLNPAFFGSQKSFDERYLRPIQDAADEDALRDLRARINPFILRRLKRDVLKDLPAKTEETAFIELDEQHLAAYHRKRLEYKQLIGGIINRGEFSQQSILVFKALTDLRRLATIPEAADDYVSGGEMSAKRQYLANMVRELVENGHKCLIFTNFLAGVELVSQDLAALGIPCLTMTGATIDRQSLVRRFQTDPTVKAFVMTLKTGGAGLNLTAADYIFILDPWWNAAAEAQAVDRAHRIGQENPVFCYRLIARGTIEERILELQKRKSALAQSLLADDAGALKTLREEDIALLLGEDND